MGMVAKSPELLQAITTQEHLEKTLKSIFKGVDIINYARKSGQVKNPETGGFFEIDFAIPKFNLNFEFQDAHHYVTTWYYQVPLEYVAHRDNLKRSLVRSQGGTLVPVPCWWDGEVDTLITEIDFHRPDLNLSFSVPQITLNPPQQFFTSTTVEGTMDLMLASFPRQEFSVDMLFPNLWWMGEKYDGVRACWDSSKKVLCSRNSIAVFLPIPLHHLFIGIGNSLDAELWFGRGFYGDAQILVSSPTEVVTWPFLRVIGFDDPTLSTRSLSFEKRYASMLSHMGDTQFTIVSAPRILCRNGSHLKMEVQKMLENGGEGVILQQRGSIYESGRSSSLLKLKASRVDFEALVIAVEHDNYTIKLPNGKILAIPLRGVAQGAQRAIAGDVVTVAHERFSRFATPVDPQILRVRRDITWEHVIKNHLSEATPSLNPQSKEAVDSHRNSPQRSLILTPAEDPKIALEKFARRKGFDPLVAANWYSVYGKIRKLAKKIGTSASLLISKSFPNLKFDLSKFIKLQKIRWSTSKRREYLNSFAKKRGMDPLVPETWYSLYKEVAANARQIKFFDRYGGNAIEGLLHIYPDIGLNASLFKSYQKAKKEEDKLKGFLEYAKMKGFNPLVPDNWYSETYESLIAFEGTKKAIFEHQGSPQAALLDIFPSIGLESVKFSRTSRDFWGSKQNRKLFFDDVAMKKGLNPLLPETWYNPCFSNPAKSIQGVRPILVRYNSSFINALCDTYPDIGIDPEKFPRRQPNYWRSPENRRKFFVEFAKQHKFDPLSPETWYSIPKQQIKKLKRIDSILSHHKSSVDTALIQLFPDIGLDINLLSSRAKKIREKIPINYKIHHHTSYVQYYDPPSKNNTV